MPLASAHEALEVRVRQHAEDEAAARQTQTLTRAVVHVEGEAAARQTQTLTRGSQRTGSHGSQRIGSAQLAQLVPLGSALLTGPAHHDEDVYFSGSDGQHSEVTDGFVHLLDFDRREDAALNFNTLSALYAQGNSLLGFKNAEDGQASDMLSMDNTLFGSKRLHASAQFIQDPQLASEQTEGGTWLGSRRLAAVALVLSQGVNLTVGAASGASEMAMGAAGGAMNALGGAAGAVSEAVGGAAGAVGGAAGAVSDAVGGAMGGAAGAVGGAAGAVSNAVGGAAGAVGGAVDGAAGALGLKKSSSPASGELRVGRRGEACCVLGEDMFEHPTHPRTSFSCTRHTRTCTRTHERTRAHRGRRENVCRQDAS